MTQLAKMVLIGVFAAAMLLLLPHSASAQTGNGTEGSVLTSRPVFTDDFREEVSRYRTQVV